MLNRWFKFLCLVIGLLLLNSCKLLSGSKAMNAGGGCKNQTPSETHTERNQSTPIFSGNESESRASESKKPVLMYYAVDSDEPFMKTTINFEVQDLRKACVAKGSEANFVIFLNSHFVSSDNGVRYFECKNGSYKDDAFLPKDIEGVLRSKQETIRKFDQDEPLPVGPLMSQNFQVSVTALWSDKDIREAFLHHPFAEPDFFMVLFNYTRKIFDPREYSFFVHMKSHGSADYMLTGLTESLKDEKTNCQNAIMKDKGIDSDKLKVDFDKVGLEDFDAEQLQALEKLGMANNFTRFEKTTVSANGQFLKRDKEGDFLDGGPQGRVLGVDGTSLGITGLGVGAGLQADQQFGMPTYAMNAVLVDLMNNYPEFPPTEIGFLFIESCDSHINGKPQLRQHYNNLVKQLKEFYSAKGSLWFRNLAWSEIFAAWQAKSQRNALAFQIEMRKETNRIVNHINGPQVPGGQ